MPNRQATGPRAAGGTGTRPFFGPLFRSMFRPDRAAHWILAGPAVRNPSAAACPRWIRLALFGLLPALLGAPAAAQRHAWHDDSYEYRRVVEVPPDRILPAILVCEFFTHGALTGRDAPLAAYGHRDAVPLRILQRGPEDFCRVALQTRDEEHRYFVYYGGRNDPDPASASWNTPHGLLLETRTWQACDLNRLESVRDAFERARPIGSDFVSDVFHRHNPFGAPGAPFLSRYRGRLEIPTTGSYTFYTSSQDCSFLLIDGAVVVAAPGRHPPDGRARLEGKLTLEKGAHALEYWHAAEGDAACMVAAWKPPGADMPERIPPVACGFGEVLHLEANRLEHRSGRPAADFRMALVGDCPLEGSDTWLVRARLLDATDPTFSDKARYLWSFGDGQSSEERNPEHVYLHPGTYAVKLAIRRAGRTIETVNRVLVRRPVVLPGEKPSGDQLADYLPRIADYDPLTLPAPSLVQWARIQLATGNPQAAVVAGKTALTEQAEHHDDASRWELVQLLAPVALDELDDAEGAFALWRAAGRTIGHRARRGLCAMEAAELCLHDLGRPAEAKPFLEFAEARLAGEAGGPAGRLQRLWGDWYARQGDREPALEAYRKADRLRARQFSATEANAWRGAYSRSVEAFLREDQLPRARQELRRWQQDFPLDTAQGYLSLLRARYWLADGKPARVIEVAHDLLAINPRSSYADRLLMLAADCHARRDNPEAARAAYQSLLADYPGSPLVDDAREKLAALEALPEDPQPDRPQPDKEPTDAP